MMQIITIITYNNYKQLNNIYRLTLKVPNVHFLSSFFMGQPWIGNQNHMMLRSVRYGGNKITIPNTQLIHSITCIRVTIYKYTMIIHHDHDHDHTLRWKFMDTPLPYVPDMWPALQTFPFDVSDFYDMWEMVFFARASLHVITWSRDHVIMCSSETSFWNVYSGKTTRTWHDLSDL